MTWDDFNNLNATQKAKLQEFAVIGTSMGGIPANPNPDTSACTPNQAKQAEVFFRELHDLIGPAMTGAKHVWKKGQKQAVDDFEANPP